MAQKLWTKKTATEAIKKRWGERFVGSIFPVSEGKHRMTLSFKGKEYVFTGKDRTKMIDEAFDVLSK